MRLLLVEDNVELSTWLARSLMRNQHSVECAFTGTHADLLLTTETFDALILDLSLPKLHGREVLRRLRTRDTELPVVIVTAFDAISERIDLLDGGADDYLAKPFHVTELEARLRALVRRASRHKAPQIRCGTLSYDTNTRVFSDKDCVLSLTPREHAVLEVLVFKFGKTVSKRALADRLDADDGDVTSDAIEIYIHRVRKKLERSNARIVTLRGLGYLLQVTNETG